MNLYDAIFVRRSTRNYFQKEIDTELLDNLMNFTKYTSLLEEQYQVTFKIIENIKGENEAVARLSVKAPYYLVIASKELDGHLLNVGYVMEQISLYLTTKGIGTCIMAIPKYKRKKLADMDYPIALIMAFGKAKENVYRTHKKAKRMSEEQLCSFKSEIPNNIKAIIKAARLAPSSLNNQPWRFVVYDNRMHIFLSKDFFMSHLLNSIREIDMGIMLSHIMLTSEELWLDAILKKQVNIAEKSFKKNEYVTSVLIK